MNLFRLKSAYHYITLPSFNGFLYRNGGSTLSSILKETCDAIYETLAPDYLRPPSSVEDWMKIAKDFETTWNMPDVLGVLHGKHNRIQCPSNTGTLSRSCEEFFTVLFCQPFAILNITLN